MEVIEKKDSFRTSHYIQCSVVLQPTGTSNLFLIKRSKFFKAVRDFLSYSTVGGKAAASDIYEPQHIYLLSDEKIIKGDWIAYSKLVRWTPVQYLGGDMIGSEKKIIASTNEYITTDIPDFIGKKHPTGLIPRISQFHINEFASAYNHGLIVKKALIEVELVMQFSHNPEFHGSGLHSVDQTRLPDLPRVRVNSKNEIRILT